MLVIIPTRIIPGVLAAACFSSVGIGSGFAAAVPFLQPGKFRVAHLIFLPVLLVALLFIRNLWRHHESTDAASEITAVSPRLLAVIFCLCLAVGISAGVMMVYATAAPM